MSKELITLCQHIVDAEREHPPGATGEFTSVILTIEEVSKIIRQRVVNAELIDNVHGESVQKLDVFANDMIIKTLGRRGYIGVMASEELEQVVQSEYVKKGMGKYAVAFDLLYGSSNITYNISVGTIFSILSERQKEKADLNRIFFNRTLH